MSNKFYELIISFLGAGFGLLITTLLSIIIWELRHLRKEIKECVPDSICHRMMSEHERRLIMLEERN